MLSMGIFALGLITGCVYCVLMAGDGMAEISQYLSQYFMDAAEGVDGRHIFISCIKQYAVLFAVMMLSGMFRAGAVLNMLCVARRGFSMGFTASSMLRTFGMRGIIASLYTMAETLLMVPALIVLSVMCLKMSVSDTEIKKKLKIFYFFFGLLMFSIFCVSALIKSYFGTTFMVKFLGKI